MDDIVFLKHKYDSKLCSFIDIDVNEEYDESIIVQLLMFQGTLGKTRRTYSKELTEYINEQNKTNKKRFSENSITRFIRSVEKKKSMYDDYICPKMPLIKTITSINIEI